MKIHVASSQSSLRVSSPAVKRAVREVLDHLAANANEVALYFVSAKRIAALHDQFFDDPTPTDCISFPLGDGHLGEVFVCPEVAVEYVQKNGGDPYEETLLYVVHGLLHLIGYDDLNPQEKRVMRKMEKRCMGHLKAKGISLGSNSL